MDVKRRNRKLGFHVWSDPREEFDVPRAFGQPELPSRNRYQAASSAAGPKGLIPRCSQSVDSAGLALAA